MSFSISLSCASGCSCAFSSRIWLSSALALSSTCWRSRCSLLPESQLKSQTLLRFCLGMARSCATLFRPCFFLSRQVFVFDKFLHELQRDWSIRRDYSQKTLNLTLSTLVDKLMLLRSRRGSPQWHVAHCAGGLLCCQLNEQLPTIDCGQMSTVRIRVEKF